MTILEHEQLSPEWFAARAGVPSASCFDKIVTSTGAPSKSAQKYLYQLAGERVTGCPEETYQNMAMVRGQELESEARRLYQLVKDTIVTEVGLCISDDGYGCSPDGLVGDVGLIEIKCPTMAVHIEYLLSGKLPTAYIQQVQGQLLVTGREWCDFISYYPAINPLIVRVYRDEKFLNCLESELKTFMQALNETVKRISQ